MTMCKWVVYGSVSMYI